MSVWIPPIHGFKTNEEHLYALFEEDLVSPYIIVTNPDAVDHNKIKETYKRFPNNFVWKKINVEIDSNLENDEDANLYIAYQVVWKNGQYVARDRIPCHFIKCKQDHPILKKESDGLSHSNNNMYIITGSVNINHLYDEGCMNSYGYCADITLP